MLDRDSHTRTLAMLRLGTLFGILYFVQGIAEPTEGLIVQPVRSLLRSWGGSAGRVTAFVALVALPWSLKPLFGLLTDLVPFCGMRRRSYLIAASSAAVAGFLGLAVMPFSRGETGGLFTGLLLTTCAVAFTDVVADALMVEHGQPLGLTGRLQAVQWASIYAATIVSGLLGGYLTEQGGLRLGLLLCGGLCAAMLGLALAVVAEPAGQASPGFTRSTRRELWQAVRSPAILSLAAFLFLMNFNPFSGSILHLFMTGPMRLGEQFYGSTVSLLALGSVAASIAYSLYCRRISMRLLVHSSIVLGIAATLAYWAMVDRLSSALVSVVVGATYMTATLVQLDLAARACPPRLAGTVFALLMGLSNLAIILSSWLGGDWYDRLAPRYGPRAAFNVLVGVGAAFTAGCWLIVPLLPIDAAQPLPLPKGENPEVATRFE